MLFNFKIQTRVQRPVEYTRGPAVKDHIASKPKTINETDQPLIFNSQTFPHLPPTRDLHSTNSSLTTGNPVLPKVIEPRQGISSPVQPKQEGDWEGGSVAGSVNQNSDVTKEKLSNLIDLLEQVQAFLPATNSV